MGMDEDEELRLALIASIESQKNENIFNDDDDENQ